MGRTVPAAITPATGSRVWRGAAMAGRRDWIIQLDDTELDQALAAVKARGLTLDDVTRDAFPLDRLGAKLAEIPDILATGRGFVLLRGAPVAGRSLDDVGLIYWGIGAHLGVGVSQSAEGDQLGHVIDRGTGETERYYTRGGALEFHMDPVDVVGLLCLRAAVSGGASRIVSALAVHNVMLDERPDLVAPRYRGFHNSRRGHGESTTPNRVPVFADGGCGLECYHLPITIRQAVEEGYRLSAREREAIAYLEAVAARPGLHLDMDFREGDIQFLNNRTILHARTDYLDHADPALRRHLLRLWLMMPDWPPRAASQDFHGRVDRTGGGVKPGVATGSPNSAPG
jgi:hypothetical protein